MPQQVEQKVVDPEAELSNAVRIFQTLAPMCSVAKRAGGIPQLAPQEKQLGILANEMKEILLCINLAKKGMHEMRDARIKRETKDGIVQYEELESVLRDEDAQQAELDCLNYLAQKQLIEMMKLVPTEADELRIIENANNSLRRMENRLDMAIKRFCIVNEDNAKVRHEIDRLLIERNNFNIQWNRTICKLIKGKEYLMDLFEIANNTFADRDECCRKLEALKWKGLFQLNRDISEMQTYECELNHLSKLEEFLRVKGSRRICEADEIEEMKRQEEIQRCEQEIAKYDALLDDIFQFAGTDKISLIIIRFKKLEIENFSCFKLLCELLQEYIIMRKDLDAIRQKIIDQKEINESRVETQHKKIEGLEKQLEEVRAANAALQNLNTEADARIQKVLKGIDELVRLAHCDVTPLLALLGNHKEVTRWNVSKFLKILETEVKTLIQVVYSAVKPPPPTPKPKKGAAAAEPERPTKLVADPYVIQLKPNRIEQLVPYQPCAYCVEDYIMNVVSETPATPADREYIEGIFHLEDINTRFGIYTLTIPAKRHPYRKKDTSNSLQPMCKMRVENIISVDVTPRNLPNILAGEKADELLKYLLKIAKLAVDRNNT